MATRRRTDEEFDRARSDAAQGDSFEADRKQAVRDAAQKPTTTLRPDFPEGWSASTTTSGRVRRLSYEPSEPLEFEDARDAVSAFMDAAGG